MITPQQDLIPLFTRELGDDFIHCPGEGKASITVGEFLGQAIQLATQLPAATHVINLCDNRYLFTLSFCAALIKQQTTLLPSNRAEETQRFLLADYTDTYLLHDGATSLVEGATAININHLDLTATAATEIPFIATDFLAAIAFTSGSTGKPKANHKYWRTFAISTLMNGKAMLPNTDQLIHTLATVPAQHMWGMETSVLMPFFWRVCVSDLRPLFPQDIANALHNLPSPRLLVTTPVHLRAIVSSKITMPDCSRILCATAPLSHQLAEDSEKLFNGDLVEVYGCSEIGSTAYRATANNQSDFWTLIDGLEFTSTKNNDEIIHQITGAHLPAAQMLQDKMQIQGNQFRLLGRNEDMIDIAGKRGSLMEMNAILLSAPGVIDGVVFLPEQSDQIQRPAALVVANESTRTDIIAHFNKHLDPVFTPRPLIFVEQLPREENGKLRRVRLLEFYQQLRTGN
jgi:acyl-coenzyme A synthetase/AMP-(fatty) acid ligase